MGTRVSTSHPAARSDRNCVCFVWLAKYCAGKDDFVNDDDDDDYGEKLEEEETEYAPLISPDPDSHP